MQRKHIVGQEIRDVLRKRGAVDFDHAPINEELYRSVCEVHGTKVSREDHQEAIDLLIGDGKIQVMTDKKDRRKKRVFLAPPKPFEGFDYESILTWRIKDFLTTLFKNEPWLPPIKAFLGPDLDDWLKIRPPTKELIGYAHWLGLTEEEANEVISITRATWGRVDRHFKGQREIQESMAQKFIEVENQVNIEEIMDAWRERRGISKKRILTNLRKRLAVLTQETLGVPKTRPVTKDS